MFQKHGGEIKRAWNMMVILRREFSDGGLEETLLERERERWE